MVIPKITPKRFVLGFALLLLVGLVIWSGLIIVRLVNLNQNAHALLESLQADKVDIQALTPNFQGTVDNLNAIQSSVSPLYPVLNLGSKLPGVGPLLGQVQPLLDFSAGLSHAGSILFTAFSTVFNSSEFVNNQTSTERLFNAIQTNLSALNNAQTIIDQISPLRQSIHPDLLPDSIQKYYLKIDQFFPLLQKAIPTIKQLPDLMGANVKTNYLVLAQNRDELRATGGFITGIGLASMEKGKLASFSIGDSYAIDDFSKGYPTPPAPLQQLMLADYWVTRDANWSPDFPTSAIQTQKLYSLSTGINTKGVIAFDQLAVKSILEVIGPVSISSYPDPVSAANVEEFMRLSWAPNPDQGVTPQWWANRKNFMGELGKIILAKFFSAGDQKLLANLAFTALGLIKSGHLLVYIDKPEVSSMLASAGLDGKLPSPSGDFLYLVDSNVGFNKTDTVVNRDLTYSIDLSNPLAPSAQISVHYQHTIQQTVTCKQEANYGDHTYVDMQTRCYWDYWRIYLHPGSQLVASQVLPVSGSMLLDGQDWPGQASLETGENNLTVAAGLLVLPTKSQQTFTLNIALPPAVLNQTSRNNWSYSLQILKQPGLLKLPVVLIVKLPPNSVFKTGSAGWVVNGDNTWTWNGTLTEAHQESFTFSIP
ncbi:MAG TPA: DUF4012 domain-containing protein [Leptolinea sp.]